MMDNWMFFITFPNVAYALQCILQSRNNNNRPNKKNDVITDLGGEGDFPMFLYDAPVFSAFLKSTSDSASYRIPHRARHSLAPVTMSVPAMRPAELESLRANSPLFACPPNRPHNHGASCSCV